MTITMEISSIDIELNAPPPIIKMEIAGIVYFGDGGGTGSGDMLKSVYDTDGNGIVDEAESAPWDGITGKPSEYPPSAHEHMQYSLVSNIQDTLSSTDQSKPLSANQGRILKGFIDTINTVLSSDDTTLDEMQELVNYIKVNREILSTLSIGNIAGLTDALAGKQDAGDYLLTSLISSWALQPTKPTYDYSELTGTPSDIVYDVSLLNVTAVDLTNLDLNTDDSAYTLVIEGNLDSGNRNFRLFPNGLTSTPYLTYGSNSTHVSANAIGSTNNVAPYAFFIKGFITIKNGNPLWIGNSYRPYLDNSSGVFDPRQQVWSDAVTNITQLIIDASGGTFINVNVRLYKGFR